jgi:hypothetical protein
MEYMGNKVSLAQWETLVTQGQEVPEEKRVRMVLLVQLEKEGNRVGKEKEA